ncbi:hypothetical protein NEUTE1DRAFT_125861 [Neurospora tetrasperma FGSC 2508]|uniref:MFS general substrate transporter n=1 Tax=Neurospora tetrasperma (strain FGSC 2508 / ATCC MYA-4615 / P0657) TaxID=510951 RepID=F8N1S8_NEUT8|nr:uncharacterized protein NEUTE1DRAFT_125861 [Neurospora tetrasperma FGSC 2508]EGO52355.1 hypothetical protein NEUTE1DRAFT_125861 [Neurospora tetrasperma FGSC 2508]
MSLLIVVAKAAQFTDAFLTALLVPLIPTILETRAGVHHKHVQFWTSILISTYGGTFAAVSSSVPYLTRQGPLLWVLLFGGLALAAGSFVLLQFYRNLFFLVLSRALHGIAGVAIARASSSLVAGVVLTASEDDGEEDGGDDETAAVDVLTWMTPAFIQNFAISVGPVSAGLLHGFFGGQAAVFTLAYAVIALTVVFGSFVAVLLPPGRYPRARGDRHEAAGLLASREDSRNYGTLSSGGGYSSREVSPCHVSSRSIRRPSLAASEVTGTQEGVLTPSVLRLIVPMGGYIALSLIGSALQSVLPIFVQRTFEWPMAASGFVFVPLSAPAALVGLLTTPLTARYAQASRLLTSFGFIAAAPAFTCLGGLTQNKMTVQTALLATLGWISVAFGLCGEPLVKEILDAVAGGEDVIGTGGLSTGAAKAESLPSLANAWGSFVGPLLVVAVMGVSGWGGLTTTLSWVCGCAGLTALFFLGGLLTEANFESAGTSSADSSDEEAAPLLDKGNPPDRSPYYQDPHTSHSGGLDKLHDEILHAPKTEQSNLTSGSSSSSTTKARRRQFSVGNFSLATTTQSTLPPGEGFQPDGSTASQLRFQASFETDLPIPARLQNPEHRLLMKMVPHLPETDPLLVTGNRYAVDQSSKQSNKNGDEESVGSKSKKHVVVFEEGAAPPELLQSRPHYIVAINRDGSPEVLSKADPKLHDLAMHISEETTDETAEQELPEGSRRYVVVVLNEGETGLELTD